MLCIARSRPIELLSEELGAPKFERVNGAIVLTDAGLTLLPYAEAVLAAARDGVDAVKALNSGESGNVSVALVGTLANDAFCRHLATIPEKPSCNRDRFANRQQPRGRRSRAAWRGYFRPALSRR